MTRVGPTSYYIGSTNTATGKTTSLTVNKPRLKNQNWAFTTVEVRVSSLSEVMSCGQRGAKWGRRGGRRQRGEGVADANVRAVFSFTRLKSLRLWIANVERVGGPQ